MKRLAFAVVLALVSFSALSQAQGQGNEDTGAVLYRNCQTALVIVNSGHATNSETDVDYGRANACMAYLLGMKDMQTMWNTINKLKHHPELSIVCIPGQTTVLETMKVYVKYLDDHPTELHEGQSIAVLQAFRDAYPCPATSGD